MGIDIIDGVIAVACEVLTQSCDRTLLVCFVPMAPTRRSIRRSTNVGCTHDRGVLWGRLSLRLPQLHQKPAEHHLHAAWIVTSCDVGLGMWDLGLGILHVGCQQLGRVRALVRERLQRVAVDQIQCSRC